MTATHTRRAALTLTTDAGRTVTLSGVGIDQHHLDWGYAVIVHRTQAATVDRAHLFADGGGRQLAYVGMPRARERSTVHAIADHLDQALEDLRTDWASDRRQHWLRDTTRPGTDPRPLPTDPAARAARLRAELDELDRAAPPDVTGQLIEARTRLEKLHLDRRDLEHGGGRWDNTPEGRAARDYRQARLDHQHARERATGRGMGWLERRQWRKEADRLAKVEAFVRDDWQKYVEPAADRLDREINDTTAETTDLERAQRLRKNWLAEHPDYARRVAATQRELQRIEEPEQARLLDALDQARHAPPTPGRDLGLSL